MIKYSVGNIDNWRVLRGWAFDEAEPGETVTAVVGVDGRQVGTALCNVARPDLRCLGLGKGNHGFELKLPAPLFDGGKHRIEISFQSSAAKAEAEKDFVLETPAIVFIHIPKTGGTSFRSIVEENFPPYTVFPDAYMIARNNWKYPFSLASLEVMTPLERKSIKLLRGHYDVGCVGEIGRPTITLTVLREPVARCVSHVWHYMRDEGATDFEEVLSRRLAEIANIQTKFLGQGSRNAADAIRNLRYFDFVGVTERLDAFARIVFAALGLPRNRLPHANRTTQEPLQDPFLRQKLAEVNACDQLVYEEAVRLTEKLISTAGEK